MIKIFRKIRQNMIKENRTSKYLLYAIGEIILVVIGILIALQLNNWKEAENASKKEVALLVNIKNDLQADISNLKRQDSLYAKSEKDLELGLDLFYKAKTITDIDSVHSLNSSYWNELYINQNTYTEMINSGSMYAMKNKELQKSINKYYLLVEAHTEYIRGVNTILSQLYELDPAMYPYKLLVAQIKNPRIDLKTIDTTWINNPKSATYLSLDNYLNATQGLSNKYRREVFGRILTGADTLLVAIDKELVLRD